MNMKKVIPGLVLATLLAIPLIGLAQPTIPAVPTTENAVWDTLNTIVNWLFAILIVGAALVIAFSAYLFLTAAGDPEKTSKARNYIMYALIAVVVAFLAKAIVVLVGNMLGVGSIIDLLY